MTDGTFALLACTLALLLIGAAAILVFSGSSNRMRERVRGATGIDTRPVVEAGPNIRVMAPDERRLLQRFFAVLGYNPELPPAYAASLPIVIAASSTAGLLAFWRVGIVFGDAAGAAGAALSAAVIARFLLRRKTRLHAAALFRQIPDAISLVLRAVRAGLPVTEALRSVSREMPSPSRDEFARVTGEAALGVPLETALWHLYGRTKIREYAFFAVTLGLQAQTGGNLAETLENLADMVRRRVAMAGKARALAAEARASAVILAGLPFVTGGIIGLLNPEYLAELFTDPRGSSFLATFAVLLSSGLLTIRWLIQRSTQD
jgi:tight adherence protein B